MPPTPQSAKIIPPTPKSQTKESSTFQENIQASLEKVALTEETINKNKTKEEDDPLAAIMEQFGSDEMLQGIMDSLMNKEILLEPMIELSSRVSTNL